ncbi:hypothetical protein OPV22_023451 [Ensete ventricosum]|uniref:Protein kinase domain-containing protein n=1 Tax=Ensete ventricosum TaxID=4639 RepID=A0AAV8QWS4_ENSVE|nr:hypothetical protein OPV22_023451 [Ensete ventricosum]
MGSSPPPPKTTTAISSRSWSIYGRAEITGRYDILGRIGSGAYADVYRGRRRSDGLDVALKEIHDYQSSAREIEALLALRGAPNVVDLLEYFWGEDEDAVLVLEFLPADLAAVIRDAKRAGAVAVGEVKQWMIQILRGLEACHRSSVVHRDLKPSSLLISADLKLADFGQVYARSAMGRLWGLSVYMVSFLGRIISVLGNLTEEAWPGCSKLPDHNKIFNKVENPIGLEACLPNRLASEVNLVKRLLCHNRANRATATETLHDRYFAEEPIPVPVNSLRVPSSRDEQNDSSQGEWANYQETESDSDHDEFGSVNVSITKKRVFYKILKVKVYVI